MKETSILIEKYRPSNITELITTDNINKIYNTITNNNKIPNLLLYGYSGQGKSTFIKILINKLNYNSLYINGSEERGNNIIELIDYYSNIYSKNKKKNNNNR